MRLKPDLSKKSADPPAQGDAMFRHGERARRFKPRFWGIVSLLFANKASAINHDGLTGRQS
jgi:hypothetical protein